jgi:hypothetical protein
MDPVGGANGGAPGGGAADGAAGGAPAPNMENAEFVAVAAVIGAVMVVTVVVGALVVPVVMVVGGKLNTEGHNTGLLVAGTFPGGLPSDIH